MTLVALASVAVGGTSAAGEKLDEPAASPAVLLREGEASLASGEIEAALASFERAATMQHSADIEVSLVRGYMQGGEYRRALAFAAHAAGAHPEDSRGSALYAWLLHIGGQQQVASRQIDSAQSVAPQSDILHSVRERLADPWSAPAAELLRPPVRLAPYAEVEPAPARVIATGTLIDGGRRALAPGDGLGAATATRWHLWLRNGLGRTVRATVERRLEIDGIALVVLRPAEALDAPADLTAASRTPFAGSVGYAVEFAPTPNSAPPAWPLLHLGFFGRSSSDQTLPALGIDLPPGPRGGPVFDAAGRIAGMAVKGQDGRGRLVSLAALQAELGEPVSQSSTAARPTRMALDQIYEYALLVALQVVVESPVRP